MNQKMNDMIPDKIIYTDGHDVEVTETKLKVKKHQYLLSGIVAHWIQILKPKRVPWIVLLIISLAVSVLGWLGMFPFSWNIQLEDQTLMINPFMIWLGLGLAVMSILALVFLKQKYAVRIATAEGEKDAVVSDNKAYISQVEAALNRTLPQNDTRNETIIVDVKEN